MTNYYPLLSFAICLGFLLPSFGKDASLVQPVNSRLERSELQLRIAKLSKEIAADSKAYERYEQRGECYFYLGDYKSAVLDYRSALSAMDFKPDQRQSEMVQVLRKNFYEKTLFNLGCALCQMGQYQDGINELTKVISLKGRYLSEAYENRAKAEKLLGNGDKSKEDFVSSKKALAAKELRQATPFATVVAERNALLKEGRKGLVEPDGVGEAQGYSLNYVAAKSQLTRETQYEHRLQLYVCLLAYELLYGCYDDFRRDLAAYKAILDDFLKYEAARQKVAQNAHIKTTDQKSQREKLLQSLAKMEKDAADNYQRFGTCKRDFSRELYLDSPKNDLTIIKDLVSQNKGSQAEQLLLQHLKVHPSDAMAYSMLFQIHAKAKKYDQAMRDIDKIIELDPLNRSVRIWRANIAEKQNKYKLAIDSYSFVLGFPINDFYTRPSGCSLDQLYFKRADAYRNLKDFANAISDYDQVIKLDPKSAEGYEFRAQCYQAEQKPELAISDLSKYLELAGPNSRVLLERSKVYQTMNKPDLAKKDSDSALALSASSKH